MMTKVSFVSQQNVYNLETQKTVSIRENCDFIIGRHALPTNINRKNKKKGEADS